MTLWWLANEITPADVILPPQGHLLTIIWGISRESCYASFVKRENEISKPFPRKHRGKKYFMTDKIRIDSYKDS